MKSLSQLDNNIADFIESTFTKFADKPAFSCLGQTLSFAQIEQKSKALACYLQQHPDLSPGDRIVVQLPNLIQYPIAAYAVFRAGMVLVNTNPLYTPREMLHQFNDSGAKAVIILEDLLPKVTEIKAQTSLKLVITTKATDLLTQDLANAPEDCQAFNKILADFADKQLLPRPSNAFTDTSVLQYTGGTTGVSKGACLSHKNLLSNATQTFLRLQDGINKGEETFICPLPLYHIYALMVSTFIYFGRGCLSVLIPNPRDMDAFIAAMKPFKPTGMAGLNTLFVGLCNHPEFKEVDLSQLKLTISGGTALTTSAAELWFEHTGCTISEGYGLSETSPVLCLNQPGKEQIGTVGQPVEDTEIQLWDEDGNQVEEGEVVARGPQVMNGYWNMDEETDKVMQNGFFKTGDIGRFMPDGSLKIVDRLKDMIIVSGFNVYPNEIEDVLTQHDDVLEAAVIGEEDDKTGEKVCAYITLKQEASIDDISMYCKANLTGYKVPKKIVVMEELPKSTVGKILRRELRCA